MGLAVRLLVAEDDPRLRAVLTRGLEANGYFVDAVDNGGEALEFIAVYDYAVVILDWRMPGVSGLKVVERLPLPTAVARTSLARSERVRGMGRRRRRGTRSVIVVRPYASAPFRFRDTLPRDVLQVCVMSERRPKPDRVGIRELRQNLSVYVRRVREEGRNYEVTERGEAVARLSPLADRPMSTYERLVADGRITPASRDLLDVRPLPARKGKRLSETLREMREEERW